MLFNIKATAINRFPETKEFHREINIEGGLPFKGNCYKGQLTKKGFEQNVLLGKELQRAYAKLLDIEEYSNEKVFFRYTAYPRTLRSGIV